MSEGTDGVILVGHGAVPSDFPREVVTQLKALERKRQATGAPPGAEETALDARIRAWPRRPDNDPYQAGLEALAERLRPRLGGVRLVVAYNEFCSPTLAEAVDGLVSGGATNVTIVPSMLTPGGIHSEVEIPREIARLQERLPHAKLRYAWPFDLDRVAEMLAEQLQRR